MTTLSDDGDRTCPLCAEEMDITDQQLKPCKCGYEICVWCWHHIMEMAEKEDAEGRCPACRTAYDKARIVKMAANCQRMVAEISSERKQKAQRAKLKTSIEARKHLNSVRVIQRNLVYIIGLPSNICDENILERREYFGQYGKVLKVSISRPTGTAGQHAPSNNTFSVYITYAREEEAIRCIQAVNNFILEGKPLRACFGTTKYCHAWLRNMTCSNPDCLYLHDVGCQDDSFTKDEIISTYTRSRVPQHGFNTSQKRTGSILPAAADDFSNSSTAFSKLTLKNGTTNSSSQIKTISCSSSTGKSTLPAAASWGTRPPNSRPVPPTGSAQNFAKPKTDQYDHGLISTTASTTQGSAWHDDEDINSKISESNYLRPYKPGITKEITTTVQEAYMDGYVSTIPSAWNDDEDEVLTGKIEENKHAPYRIGDLQPLSSNLDPQNESSETIVSSENEEQSIDHNETERPKTFALKVCDDQPVVHAKENVMEEIRGFDQSIRNVCDALSSTCLDYNDEATCLSGNQHESSGPESYLELMHLQNSHLLNQAECSLLPPVTNDSSFPNQICSNPQGVSFPAGDRGDNTGTADERHHGHPEISSSSFISSFDKLNARNYGRWNDIGSEWSTSCVNDANSSLKLESRSRAPGDYTSIPANAHQEDIFSTFDGRIGKGVEHPNWNYVEDMARCADRNDYRNADKSASVNTEESKIISNILSLDFDPWGDMLSSTNNFVRMLGECERDHTVYNLPTPSKPKNSGVSRFSFARQDNQGNLIERPFGNSSEDRMLELSQSFSEGGGQNGFMSGPFEGSNVMNRHNHNFTLDRPSGALRTKVSAPPGFSAPSRAMHSGFSTQDQSYQIFDPTYSAGGSYQNQFIKSTSDVEFIDPAILAMGKGRRPGVNDLGLLDMKSISSFPAQLSTSNNDPRIQVLMQQSLSQCQNLKIPTNAGESFVPLNENYFSSPYLSQNRVPSSQLTQLPGQQLRNSQYVNSQWDGWNNMQVGNGISLGGEFSRNERFGTHGFYGHNEENNFHIPSSADLYKRAFGL